MQEIVISEYGPLVLLQTERLFRGCVCILTRPFLNYTPERTYFVGLECGSQCNALHRNSTPRATLLATDSRGTCQISCVLIPLPPPPHMAAMLCQKKQWAALHCRRSRKTLKQAPNAGPQQTARSAALRTDLFFSLLRVSCPKCWYLVSVLI